VSRDLARAEFALCRGTGAGVVQDLLQPIPRAVLAHCGVGLNIREPAALFGFERLNALESECHCSLAHSLLSYLTL
jgi:hypothetical protein